MKSKKKQITNHGIRCTCALRSHSRISERTFTVSAVTTFHQSKALFFVAFHVPILFFFLQILLSSRSHSHTHATHDSLSLSLSLFSRTRSFRWPAFALRETKEQYARVSLSPDNAITVYRFSVVRRPEIPTNQLKLTNPNNNETETELFVCDPVARY